MRWKSVWAGAALVALAPLLGGCCTICDFIGCGPQPTNGRTDGTGGSGGKKAGDPIPQNPGVFQGLVTVLKTSGLSEFVIGYAVSDSDFSNMTLWLLSDGYDHPLVLNPNEGVKMVVRELGSKTREEFCQWYEDFENDAGTLESEKLVGPIKLLDVRTDLMGSASNGCAEVPNPGGS